MKKWLRRFVLILTILAGILLIIGYFRFQDRHPDYTLDLDIEAGKKGMLSVGFAKRSITPVITDTWTDVNGDAVYNTDDGDSYTDVNKNGKFDAWWMAGFSQGRAANGIHDSLWARVMVIDDGSTRLAIVALDAIGFGHDDVINVRKRLPKDAAITYAMIASTHTHEAPDLLGMWGPGMFTNGIDKAYQENVYKQTAAAIVEAVNNIRPAKLKVAQDLEGPIHLVNDSRKPTVLDPGLRLIQAIDVDNGSTLGTLISWANHPETLWSKNLLITSDFPHFVRTAFEKGIYIGDSLIRNGLGGTAVFVNGSIGGLMTTQPKFGIQDPWRDTTYFEPSFDKAQSQGQQLAWIGMEALDSNAVEIEKGSIGVRSKTISLPLDNSLYRLAAFVGVLDRGTTDWMLLRTEVAAWKLGPISCLMIPGEIYPEIVNGGVEAPDGQDFDLPPSEAVPLRSMMDGKFKFVIGLANDEIGYIIPKSQWDEELPFTYENESAPYGEINSLGTETAPLLYKELKEVIEEVK